MLFLPLLLLILFLRTAGPNFWLVIFTNVIFTFITSYSIFRQLALISGGFLFVGGSLQLRPKNSTGFQISIFSLFILVLSYPLFHIHENMDVRVTILITIR